MSGERGAAPLESLLVLAQYLLPHHALSRIVLRATRLRIRWWKNLLIRFVVRHYGVNLDEALDPDPDAYPCFNAFFTRALRPDARPLDPDPNHFLCPVDGRVSEAGTIDDDRLLQAKGRHYRLDELLADDPDTAARFRNGRFATLYLSPRDYHRIHMPCDGRLDHTLYVPGRLFSVAPHTVRRVPRLFARNERLACLFETDAGPVALIAVGALFVSAIETVWSGLETPPHGWRIRRKDYPAKGEGVVRLPRGAELGRFNMGSTVIVLFPPGAATLDPAITAGAPVRMGQTLARRAGPD